MKTKLRSHAMILACLIITGCATGYQAGGLTGGYSDTQLQENLFMVSFDGNGYTSKGRTTDLGLLRCAELTTKYGYKFFAILNSESEASTAYYTTPSTQNTTAHISSFGNTAVGSANTYSSGSVTIPIVKPSTSFVIMCFHDRSESPLYLFDAQFLFQSVATKYGLKVVDGKIEWPTPPPRHFNSQTARWE